jgi:hypothetical protein
MKSNSHIDTVYNVQLCNYHHDIGIINLRID